MTFSAAAVVYIINYNLISLYVQTVIIIYERDVSDKNPMFNNIILYMLSLTMSIKRKCGVIQSNGGGGHLNYLQSVNSTYLLKTSPAAAAHHNIIIYYWALLYKRSDFRLSLKIIATEKILCFTLYTMYLRTVRLTMEGMWTVYRVYNTYHRY